MRDKQSYDRNRHKDIRINGKKAKMLGYAFFTHPADRTDCILLKTKYPGNYPADLCTEQCLPFVLELPTPDGCLVMTGKLRSIASSPTMAEFGFEILSKTITAV